MTSYLFKLICASVLFIPAAAVKAEYLHSRFLERNQDNIVYGLVRAEALAGQEPVKPIQEQPKLLLIWMLISFVIICILSYLVYERHNKMKTEDGIEPQCGWRSWLCVCGCLICGIGTPITCCFPIDEERVSCRKLLIGDNEREANPKW
eukprot:gnl/TRDRNA2_/TRDRNA2_171402_c0_seq3.p1 gnl/TRDRNA2_/TRDRNA2_171402_c0~~gnl/TRDRNA2_/TRDRNA2_171402_c0_seq3.p1  ORF type:complete len:149 (+),score=21.01 gnl/TRDRNA2_/TRDRNA2_171402_c0_seq3:141-587(+)